MYRRAFGPSVSMSTSSAQPTSTPAPAGTPRPFESSPTEVLPRARDLRELRRRLKTDGPADATTTRRRARIAAWFATHAASLAVGAAALVVVALVLGTGIQRYPGFSDDEGTYVAQAWAVRAHGSLAHYTYWYDHPPLGWLQLAAARWLLGPILHSGSAVADGRTLMLIPALVSAALLFVLARRLGLRRGFAAGAVLLFALSPLAVASLRMVFLDNIATPWILAAFVLAASPERRLWAYAGGGVCFAVAVLTKETSLIVLPGLVVAVSQGVDRRTRAFCLTAFATMLVLGLLAYPLFAVLKGELLPGPGHVSLVEALRFQVYGRASTGSALLPGTLSRQLVANWLSVDPWLLVLGIVALPVGLWIRRLRPLGVALGCLVVMGLRPGYLPQPYVIALLPFCGLLAMGALDAAWGRTRRPALRRGGIAVVALLLAVLGFGRSWYAADGYAMSQDANRPLLAAQRWIPQHIDHRARLLVDDTFYVDLVRSGFAPRFGAVWFYKLDFTTNLDPSIVRHLPQGWRAFDYVVSTDVIRSALAENPASLSQVRLALQHSTPVVTFGSGPGRAEVRRITGIGTGSGLLPRPRVAPPAAPAAAPPAPVAAAPHRTARRAHHHPRRHRHARRHHHHRRKHR
ncbi:MAG: Dolichyl-phosphate-mannose-protein mannosyltransferase [Solirubrobacterales bacterium]|nr:Dolichyl-phosphate-mannose-protein mannosyltransferase [Solirubrobacterales bacterium]